MEREVGKRQDQFKEERSPANQPPNPKLQEEAMDGLDKRAPMAKQPDTAKLHRVEIDGAEQEKAARRADLKASIRNQASESKSAEQSKDQPQKG